MGGGPTPRLSVPMVRSILPIIPSRVDEGLRGNMVLGMPEGRLRVAHFNEELRG